ncbi:IPT/TIG domain-containing protein [Actinoplanes sp. NPDC051861]|uniref:IPT/TIG domain-containing protein n=1 Tax=Actinoplanes sp. NPDC051861 TaxID=3155170 RepID=UPI0034172BDF
MKKSLATACAAVVTAGVTLVAVGASAAPAVPAVASISPARLSAAGGTPVTITGSNFTGVTAVKIGGSDATEVTVVSATKITAVAPAGSNGNAAVAVTSSAGTSGARNVIYRTPLGIAASGGLVVKALGGPLTLEITGGTIGATARDYAAERITVKMGRSVLKSAYVDSTHLTVTMPGLAAEEAQITVEHDTVPGAPATVDLAPVVSSLSAKEDTVVGGKTVTVKVAGANIAGATGFTFGGVPADCEAKGTGMATTFACVVPPATEAGPVWVAFTSAAGTPSRFTTAATFNYTD